MSQSTAQFTTWIRRFHPATDGSAGLVCLPHAGGSASFFFPLSKALAPAIEVLAVQYPGRQDRRREPNIDSVAELVDQIVAALAPLADRPLALFGHSMGAVLGYEVALRLSEAGWPPTRLFVSGRRAPSRARDDQVHRMSDQQIVAELRKVNGTEADALADPDILRMIMPAVRSDYRAVETHRYDPARVLDCPITVLTGHSDPYVTVEEACAWEEHTTGATELRVLPGGHFYLVEQSSQVQDIIRSRMSPAPATSNPGG